MAAGYGKPCRSWSLASSRPLTVLALLAVPELVSTANHRLSAAAAGKLGARVVRVEFDVGTPAAALRSTVAAITRRGARPLLLAGFHGRMPTEAEARNLGGWAAAFGPGGSFWAKHRRHRLPVRLIEFGNETSYRDQYGDTTPTSPTGTEPSCPRFASPRPTGRSATGASACWRRRTTAAPRRRSGWRACSPPCRSSAGSPPAGRWTPTARAGSGSPSCTAWPRKPRRWGAPASVPIDVTEYGISSSGVAALTGGGIRPATFGL